MLCLKELSHMQRHAYDYCCSPEYTHTHTRVPTVIVALTEGLVVAVSRPLFLLPTPGGVVTMTKPLPPDTLGGGIYIIMSNHGTRRLVCMCNFLEGENSLSGDYLWICVSMLCQTGCLSSSSITIV